MMRIYKRPESVLVVVYTAGGDVLLLKRADHPSFWQSVTGAMRWDEDDPRASAVRELGEETGFAAAPSGLEDLGLVQRYEIFPQWRQRYAPGVLENTERAFALQVPRRMPLAAHPEHAEYAWLDIATALARATSWTDRVAIERIGARLKTTVR